jgi:AraC-like DNA-binding protein
MDNKELLATKYLQIWHNKSDQGQGEIDFSSHSHPENEIHYVIRGDVEFNVEGYTYFPVPESLLMVPANCFHGWIPRTRKLYHRIAILFLPEMLDPSEQAAFMGLFEDGPRYFPNLSGLDIVFFVQSLLKCEKMEEPLRCLSLKCRLISLLSEIVLLHSTPFRELASRDNRIQGLLKYLAENLQEELALDEVAGRFNLSKNHLNVLFRQATGTTVHRYIRMKRLGLARQEIARGGHPEEAAYGAGFKDYSNFFRAYKSFYGSSPSDAGLC